MRNNLYTLILIFLLFSGCQQNKGFDPLLGFNIGSEENEWNTHRDELIQRRVLKEDFADTMSGGYLDVTELESFLNSPLSKGYDYENGFKKYLFNFKLDKEYPVKLLLNPDGYYQGKLRVVKLDFTRDSVFNFDDGGQYADNIGIENANLKKIKGYLSSYYQKADSSIVLENEEGKDSLKVSIWDKNNFQLKCMNDLPKEDKDTGEVIHEIAYCRYEMQSYDEVIKKLKNEIRSNFEPSDLVTIETSPPTFDLDMEFGIHIRKIRRTGIEEPRGIKSIKFDIYIFSQFKEEVLKIEDQVINFSTPLDRYNYSQDDIIVFPSRTQNWMPLPDSIRYNEEFYNQHLRKGYTKIEIKKILFEDGYVFNSGERLQW